MPPQHEALKQTPSAPHPRDVQDGEIENESSAHVAREDEDEVTDDDEQTAMTSNNKPFNKDEILLSSPPIPTPRKEPLPVDRDWLKKLLETYPNPATPPDLAGKALVVAPMVDQSDLPFRILCRRYGANLAFTPMIHCRMYMRNHIYRKRFTPTTTLPPEHPLVGQICGSDLEKVLPTALSIQPYVDAIDINCGCPQGIAKRGKYGAFLLEEPHRLIQVIRCLVRHLDVPVTVKVRLLPGKDAHGNDDYHSCDVEGSLRLYERLVDEGISMLTIHGRNRLQKGPYTGKADWDAIRQAVVRLGHRIPILANGGISSLEELRACLACTGADGVMVSEALLEYPALFALEPGTNRCSEEEPTTSGRTVGSNKNNNNAPVPPYPPGRVKLAFEFLQVARDFPPDEGGQGSGLKCIRMHIHRMCHEDLQCFPKFRNLVVKAKSCDELYDCLVLLQTLHEQEHHVIASERLSWYVRYRFDDKDDDCKKRSTGGGFERGDQLVKSSTTAAVESSTQDEEEEEEVFHDLFGTKDEWGGI